MSFGDDTLGELYTRTYVKVQWPCTGYEWTIWWSVALHGFACQVTIAALLTREHRRWLAYGGLSGPGAGQI